MRESEGGRTEWMKMMRKDYRCEEETGKNRNRNTAGKERGLKFRKKVEFSFERASLAQTMLT